MTFANYHFMVMQREYKSFPNSYILFNPPHLRGYFIYHQFNIKTFYTLATQCVYVFCMDFRTTSLYYPTRSSWLTCIIETECVCCALITESLYIILANLRISRLNICSKHILIHHYVKG